MQLRSVDSVGAEAWYCPMAHVVTLTQVASEPDSFLNVEPRIQLMQTWSENGLGGYTVVIKISIEHNLSRIITV